MTQKQNIPPLPGAFPTVIQRKTRVVETAITKTKKDTIDNNHTTSLRLKSQVGKLKTYFHRHDNQQVVVENSKISKRKTFWSRKKKQQEIQQQTSNTVVVGTVFSLSVPITISNTTTHYHSKNEVSTTTTKPYSSSIIQQLVILPPLQIYGFMFIITLFLLVVAFALLQVHRSISIIELGVEGIKYILVGLTSNSISLFTYIKSWF